MNKCITFGIVPGDIPQLFFVCVCGGGTIFTSDSLLRLRRRMWIMLADNSALLLDRSWNGREPLCVQFS